MFINAFRLIWFFVASTASANSASPIDVQLANLGKPLASDSGVSRNFREAVGAARGRHIAALRSAAQELKKDEAFSDYGSWFLGESYMMEALSKSKSREYLLARGSAENAIRAWIEIEIERPDSALMSYLPSKLARAEMIVGDASYFQKNWAHAIKHYDRSFRRIANERLLAEIPQSVLTNYAKACKKLGSTICKARLRELADRYPRASQEHQKLAAEIPDLDAAGVDRPSFPSQIQTYKGVDEDWVAFSEAIAIYLKGDYSDAISSIDAFLNKYPKSTFRHRALYWLGRAYSKKGKREASVQLQKKILKESPLGYYGILASFSTEKLTEEYIQSELPLAAQRDPLLTISERAYLERAERLFSFGLRDLAAFELDRIQLGKSWGNAFLIYLASLQYEVGNYLGSFRVLTELLNRGHEGVFSSHGLRLIFPVANFDLIKKYAELNGLDPILVLSLMKQESGFEADISSSAGARGLMQLMPFTAVDVDSTVQQSELGDVETNIRLGTKYLATVLRQFNGNAVLALAGYNAGPSKANQWFSDRNLSWTMHEFIESIPYKETREYVSSILRNYFWYSHMLNGERVNSFEKFWIQPDPVQKVTSRPDGQQPSTL